MFSTRSTRALLPRMRMAPHAGRAGNGPRGCGSDARLPATSAAAPGAVASSSDAAPNQLCAAAALGTDESLRSLAIERAEDYAYTSQGGSISIDGVDDASNFEQTKQALELVGIPEAAQQVSGGGGGSGA